MRILLVEASPFLRFLFREALQRAGHEIIAEYASLEEAAGQKDNIGPEVIIVDPEGEPSTWEAKIRELASHFPGAHLLVLSSSTLNDKNEFISLKKPCPPETVLTAIHRLTDRLLTV